MIGTKIGHPYSSPLLLHRLNATLWLVVKMWSAGWNKKSIAGCLDLSQRHVRRVIDNFQQDDSAAPEDKRTQRPPNHPANQLTLPFLKEILDI